MTNIIYNIFHQLFIYNFTYGRINREPIGYTAISIIIQSRLAQEEKTRQVTIIEHFQIHVTWQVSLNFNSFSNSSKTKFEKRGCSTDNVRIKETKIICQVWYGKTILDFTNESGLGVTSISPEPKYKALHTFGQLVAAVFAAKRKWVSTTANKKP